MAQGIGIKPPYDHTYSNFSGYEHNSTFFAL